MASPHITICPPAPQTEHFDEHSFVHRAHAVGARYTPTGWDTTGIDWKDYARMHVSRRGSAKNKKRNPIPLWALDDVKTREVIVRYLEYRNYLPAATDKSYEERLAIVNAAVTRQLPGLAQRLDGFYSRQVSDVEFQNTDTRIVLERRGMVALVGAVVYLSYRLNYNSTEVAKEIGIKPPHVRILLWRMNKIARQIEQGLPHRQLRQSYYDYSEDMIDAVREARKHGDTWREIAEAMGEEFKWTLVCASYRKYVPKRVAVPKPARVSVPRKWTSERFAQIKLWRSKGLTYRQIATKLGANIHTLFAMVHRFHKKRAAAQVPSGSQLVG